MVRVLRWSVLAVGFLALVSPTEAQNKNKPKPNAKGTDASPLEYQQVLAAGEVTGKISDIDFTKRLVTIQIDTLSAQQGGGNNQGQALQNLARQQQQLVRQIFQRPNQNNNPAQQARQMQQQAAQAQRQQVQAMNRGGGGVKTVKKEFEFQADEKAKVRLMTLPQEYDERGKPKQYTAAELKELKGTNTSLPGYQFDFESLHPGQMVKLYVAGPKRSGNAQPAKNKDGDADKEKDMPVFVPDGTKPRTTMILVVKDEGTASPGKGDKKKK